MTHLLSRTICTCCLLGLFGRAADAHTGPFDGQRFQGRIALSSDGNFNDEDDWGAFPVSIAILDAFGVTNKLVHVDYNNILAKNDRRFYREMSASVRGCVKRYNLPETVFHDCQTNLDRAVESIRRAINASSANNPLYYVLAGPMEVPFLGIQKSDPEKRKFVYCISHSAWNDGYTRRDGGLHSHNKRDVIPSGINWIQIQDGNPRLAFPGGVGKASTPQQWSKFRWLRESDDQRLNWIYTRLLAEKRGDISDATMTYFLLTGDEQADLPKLEHLLNRRQRPAIPAQRRVLRIEAENFVQLEQYQVRFGDRRASHRVSVSSGGGQVARIATPFLQPYAAERGTYSLSVRYQEAPEQQSTLTVMVDGQEHGDAWTTAGGSEWKTHPIPGVVLRTGDRIEVSVRANRGSPVNLDFVELQYQGRAPE